MPNPLYDYADPDHPMLQPPGGPETGAGLGGEVGPGNAYDALMGYVRRVMATDPAATQKALQDQAAAERQRSVDMGLADPVTGLPTAKGAATAATHYGNALLFGTFGGEGALTADMGKLALARSLESKSVGRDDILSQTGWFRGPDGRWRFEINDQGMTVNQRTPNPTTLGATVSHPELFAAYPELAETSVVRAGKPGGGFYAPTEPPMITVGPNAKPESVFLHEIQHNVQDIEGFERGGSPSTSVLRPEFMPLLKERIDKITTPLSYEAYADAAWGGERSPASLADYQNTYLPSVPKTVRLDSQLGRHAQDSVAEEIYRRLFGEVEARAVQTRASMSPQARLDAGPWWGAWDVPENQFIRRNVKP